MLDLSEHTEACNMFCCSRFASKPRTSHCLYLHRSVTAQNSQGAQVLYKHFMKDFLANARGGSTSGEGKSDVSIMKCMESSIHQRVQPVYWRARVACVLRHHEHVGLKRRDPSRPVPGR